jgi:hypothetical protein
MRKITSYLAATAVILAVPEKALASYSTAIFTAQNEYCSQVAASGGAIVDNALQIDRAVTKAINIWKEYIKDRDLFRSQVVQAINSGGCGSRGEALRPPPERQAPPLLYPVAPARPAYGGKCVAVINGIRLKTCSAAF